MTAGAPFEPLVVPGGLADPSIRFCSSVIDTVLPTDLHPDEVVSLPVHAVEKRRQEFAAGRVSASRAMASLGVPARPVGMASDRSPIWPDGIVGSISHSGTVAMAAVACRSSGIVAIGLDIEENLPLEAELFEEICANDELRWLKIHAPAERGMLAKAIFCAKEAAYKCQYPLSRRMFGFQTLHVSLDLPAKRFTAAFLEDVSPFASGDRVYGRISISGDHFVAVATLKHF